MPLYSYRCRKCEHEGDHLQKMADAPLLECPECLGKDYLRQITLPNQKIRACKSSEELGIKLPTDKEIYEKKKKVEDSLPWWRDGSVEGLPKKEKPIKMDKIKDVNHYVETGEIK